MAISNFAAAQTRFVRMTLPKALQSTATEFETITANVTFNYKDGRSVDGQIRAAVPFRGSGYVSVEFSSNLVDGKTVTNNFLSAYPQFFRTGGSGSFDYDACIDDCMRQFTGPDGTKIPGRGACKFKCFLQAISSEIVNTVVPAIVTIVVKSLTS